MSTLYELTTDLLEIEEGLTEITGNEAEKLEEIKEIIKQEIQNKNTRIVSVIIDIDSDINSLDLEIKRMQELKKIKKNSLDRLKSNIKECMELLGIKKVET
ncbi:TPA: siphovirus Gp157 family protein, partial [Clostridioides difficile]|nr:siphovirus Gp157 family protein [Clostridioides difficile]HBH2617698.1 siphovirus Gp157 family protein [Clostridioides difficile]HBH2621987.1 siphovirus Gp157 family protein [Clostridioides difficile]HBH2698103.1 siphovirus Gp157 family protein [Clostridioides difficile]HBH2702133.1 siphovirus Gp157 family protein [Clostridioides difficile]